MNTPTHSTHAGRHGRGVADYLKLALCLAVTLASLGPGAKAQQTQPPQQQLSATLSASRNPVYLNEHFTITLTITARGFQLGSNFHLSNLPPGELLTLGTFKELPKQRKRQDGVIVETRRFRCTAQPRRSGGIVLSPKLQAQVYVRRSGLFGSTRLQSTHETGVSPLKLSVRALPASNKPGAFSGAVGRFEFDVAISPTEVAVGDLVTLQMVIRGEGHFQEESWPTLTSGRHFKVYPPKILSGVSESVRQVEQIVIPQSTNAVTLTGVSFNYFDPIAGTYVTKHRGPFALAFRPEKEIMKAKPFVPESTTPTAEQRTLSPAGSPAARRPAHARLQDDAMRMTGLVLRTAGIALILYGVFMFSRWMRRRRRTPARPWVLRSILSTATAIACLLGSFYLEKGAAARTPSRALGREVEARLAPAYSALPTFSLPTGSVVTPLESYEAWIKISHGDRRGWVPSNALDSQQDAR